MESEGWLGGFEDRADGIKKLAGFEDFPETVIKESCNEGLDLAFDHGAVGDAKAI